MCEFGPVRSGPLISGPLFGTSSLSYKELNDLGSMNREAEMLHSGKLLQFHICLPANWKFIFV